MVVEHNSRSTIYRSPFGAVPCLSRIILRLFAKTDEIPRSVSLIYRFKDEELIKLPMYFVQSIAAGSLYEAIIEAPDTPGLLWYYFKLETNSQTFYFGNNEEALGGIGRMYEDVPPEYQVTVYRGDYKTPDWLKRSVVYQIFPDRFCRGDMDSFEGHGRKNIIRREWGDMPYYKAEQFGGEYLSNDFFGGNLDGVRKKLPYLKELGITAIYLNPIFTAYSNHKYDTGDYESIDPMFGDNGLFECLCKEAEERGIRVILDGVFNHTGSDSKYFNKDGTYPTVGAYQSEDSPYFGWYKFTKHPDEYECWWGIKTLPAVNENEPSFVDYSLTAPDAIIKKWLHLGASGWRLDVADELPSEFIKTMRREVKSAKEDAVIIGEVWEDASNKISYGEQREYLLGEELDSVMNYPFRRAVVDFACGVIDAQSFADRAMSQKENYPREAFYAMLNMLSTHDVERILTVLGGGLQSHQLSKDERASFVLDEAALDLAKKRLENVLLLQMTVPGVPCIYYGDEAGMEGFEDPLNRRTYPWGSEDSDVMSLYRRMIQLRRTNSIFVDGDYEIIYAYKACLAYARSTKSRLLVLSINMDTEDEVFVRLDIARFRPAQAVDYQSKEIVDLDDGIIIYELPPLGNRTIEILLETDNADTSPPQCQ
jgi:cyclomaltodextrinase